MQEIAGWIAPAATMIAAMMTAANLGARITGYGFVVFTIGSVAWTMVGFASGQQNLIIANAFLTLVNIVGIWRWLGRQAKYEDGGRRAAARSARSRSPTLFSAGSIVGASVTDRDGETIGAVVDAMLRCGSRDLAYVVVSEGGAASLGGTLRAVDPNLLTFAPDGVRTELSAAELGELPELASDDWPETLPETMPAAAAARPAPA